MRALVIPIWIVSFLPLLAAGPDDLRQTAAARAACGPQEAKFKVDYVDAKTPAPPAAGQATLYVIASKQGTSCFRCGITVKVGMDGRWVGAVKGTSYLQVPADAGLHHLCVNWQGGGRESSEWVGLRSLKTEAGQVYYLSVNELIARYQGGELRKLSLDPTDEDEAKMLLEAYPQVVATLDH